MIFLLKQGEIMPETESKPIPETAPAENSTTESQENPDKSSESSTETTPETEKIVLRENEWMLRPCDMYKEEYDDCRSIRARFHQYFIFGKYLDCSQWKIDYTNCYHWNRYKSEEAFNDLVQSEKNRIRQRLKAHYENNVWENRKEPPENWNAPLPDWLQEEYKDSFLQDVSEQLKVGKTPNFGCTIL